MSLRLAVLGAAHSHVRYALDEADLRDDVELVGVSDSDHRRLLEEQHPDVVMVADVYADRGAAIVDALAAGAHVLADKPLCTDLGQLDAIEKAARASGRTVSLLLEKRHYPETLAARALLDAGELGELVQVASTGPHKLNRSSRPEWFLRRETYGGILGDLAVHDVDLVLLLSGATGGTVAGATERSGEFDRYGSLLLRAGAVTATIEVNWLTPAASPWHGDYRMRLTGTRGTAELFWAQGRLVVTTDDAPPHQVELPPGRRPAEEALDAFVAGREPEAGTAASLLATRVALLAQESADGDGAVATWQAPAPPS
jgi:predicted dehydrogenase